MKNTLLRTSFIRIAWISLSLICSSNAFAVQNVTQSPWYPIGFGGGGFMMSVNTFPTAGTLPNGSYSVLTGCDSSAGFMSFDAGNSWTQLADPNTMGGTKTDGAVVFVTAEFDPADTGGKSAFMAMGNTLYHVQQVNSSYTYTSVLSGTNGGISSLGFAPGGAPFTAYLGTGGIRPFLNSGFGHSLGDTVYPTNTPTIYKTTNGGSTWTPAGTLASSGTVFKVVAAAASRVYISTDVGLFWTTNGGAIWQQIGNSGTAKLPHNALFGLAVVAGSSGDNSDTLYVTLQPYADIKAYATNPTGYVASNPTYVGGLFKSSDSGATWTHLTLGDTPPAAGSLWDTTSHLFDVVVSSLNSSRVYVAYTNPLFNAGMTSNTAADSCVFFSSNGGSSFVPLNVYSSSDNYIGSFQPQRLAVHALSTSQDELFVMGENAGQFKGVGVDGAMTFTSVGGTSIPAPGAVGTVAGRSDALFRGWGLDAGLGGRVAQDPVNPQIVYYNDKDRGFWKSTDFGNSYRFIYNPSLANQGDGRGIFPDPDNVPSPANDTNSGSSVTNYVYGYIGRKDYRLADPDFGHFVVSANGGVPISKMGDSFADAAMTAFPDLFVWDVALDPTVLAPSALASRKLYLAEGDGPFSPFQIRIYLDTKSFDVYLNYVLLNTHPLPFYTASSGDITTVRFSMEGDAGSFYLDDYSMLASNPPTGGTVTSEANVSFDSGIPLSGWNTSVSGAGSSVVAKSDFSSPTAGAVLITGGSGGYARFDHPLPGTYTAGQLQINFEVMPVTVASGKKYVCQFLDSSGNVAGAVLVDGNHVEALATKGTPKEQDLSNDSQAHTLIRPANGHLGVYVRTGTGPTYTWSNLATDPGLASTAGLRQMQLDPASSYSGDLLALDANYNGGLYRHSVASSTWQLLQATNQGRAFEVIPTTGGNDLVVLAASSGGANSMYRAILPGAFSAITGPLPATTSMPTKEYVSMQSYGATGLYVGTSNGVYYTADITASSPTWTALFPTALGTPDGGQGYGSIYNLDFPSSTWGSSLTSGRQGSGTMRSDFLPFTVVAYQGKSGSTFVDSQYYIPTIAFDGCRPNLDAGWQISVLPNVFDLARNHLYCFTTSDLDKASTAAAQVQLEIGQATVVYVAVASGFTPSWLAGSGFSAVSGGSFNLQYRDNSSVTQGMNLYTATLAANTLLTLGGASAGTTGTAPVNYVVLVQPAPEVFYNFTSSDVSAWTNVGSWTRTDNSGNWVYKSPLTTGYAEAIVGPAVLDASIEAAVESVNPWASGAVAGLVARSDGAGNEYRFKYLPTAPNPDSTLGQLSITRVNGGVETTLASLGYSASPLVPGTSYLFSFVVRGNLLLGSINGTQVISANDRNPTTALGAGQSGLLSEANRTLFDNYTEITY